MLRRVAAIAIASVMLGGGLLPAAAPPPHPALARGLELMREGDFEAAVLELDAAVRRIESDPSAERHRPWAYVYLGVAYLELEQEAVARGKFREALARDPGLRLVPAEFSAQSIRVFEGERAQAVAAAPPPAPVAVRPTPSASVAPAGKGSKGPLVAVILGGVAAAGAAVALGGGGGGGATTPPSTAPGATATTTTTTTTTVPTTIPPTTQPPGTMPPPPSCAYNVAGQVNVPVTGCIGCTCSVSATAACAWTARTSDPGMITITQGSGTGNGHVTFNVGPSLSPRTGRITLAQGGGTCTVSQGTLFAPAVARP